MVFLVWFVPLSSFHLTTLATRSDRQNGALLDRWIVGSLDGDACLCAFWCVCGYLCLCRIERSCVWEAMWERILARLGVVLSVYVVVWMLGNRPNRPFRSDTQSVCLCVCLWDVNGVCDKKALTNRLSNEQKSRHGSFTRVTINDPNHRTVPHQRSQPYLTNLTNRTSPNNPTLSTSTNQQTNKPRYVIERRQRTKSTSTSTPTSTLTLT